MLFFFLLIIICFIVMNSIRDFVIIGMFFFLGCKGNLIFRIINLVIGLI